MHRTLAIAFLIGILSAQAPGAGAPARQATAESGCAQEQLRDLEGKLRQLERAQRRIRDELRVLNMSHGPVLVLELDPAQGDKGSDSFVEPFDAKLAPGWSWVREDSKAWRIDKGVLLIRTSTGALWQKQNNTENLLLRTPAKGKDGTLIVEVHVENEPTNAFEHAGLVWYCDDDNYVILVREKVGKQPIVQLVSETNGKPKVGFAEKPFQPARVWLRMEIANGKARGLYRATPADEWQTLGQCDLPVKGEPRVGLITGYAPKDKEHWSRFDHFSIVRKAK